MRQLPGRCLENSRRHKRDVALLFYVWIVEGVMELHRIGFGIVFWGEATT